MTLVVENVSKSFGGFKAVDQASLRVPEGLMVGLIGPNGAGKSTLLSLVSGLIAPDEGTLSYAKSNVGQLSTVQRARAGIGRTFQVPREFGGLTVRENLLAAIRNQPGERLWLLVGARARVAEAERRYKARVDETLEEFGLAGVAGLAASSLSGGQKKLLELARIWMTKPSILLLDEPFSGVNPVLIEVISGHIRRLNEMGVSCLIVEHNLAALGRLVPEFCAMERGRTIVTGTPDEVLAHPDVREAYLGRSK